MGDAPRRPAAQRPRTGGRSPCEIRKPLGSSGRTAPHAFDVADILQLDRAAAIVVSTFLAALPRV